MQVLKQDKYQNCIKVCFDCAGSYEACATGCLREDNVKMLTRCVQLNRDSADICTLAGQYMSRDSEYAKNIYRVCADVCDACAESCRSFADECRKMMR